MKNLEIPNQYLQHSIFTFTMATVICSTVRKWEHLLQQRTQSKIDKCSLMMFSFSSSNRGVNKGNVQLLSHYLLMPSRQLGLRIIFYSAQGILLLFFRFETSTVQYRGRIQIKTWFMGLYAGVDYNLTLCPPTESTPKHLPWALGNPMPESNLTVCQSRLDSPVRDLASVQSAKVVKLAKKKICI